MSLTNVLTKGVYFICSCVIFFLFLFNSFFAYAKTLPTKIKITDYHCISNVINTISADIILNKKDIYAGYEKVLPIKMEKNFSASCFFPQATNSEIYYFSRSNYPITADGFLKISPNFSAKIDINTSDNKLYTVPFTRLSDSRSVKYEAGKKSVKFFSGKTGHLTLRIDKPFAGKKKINAEIARLFAVVDGDAIFDSTQVLQKINLKASIDSPAECQFIEKNNFSINFDRISMNELREEEPPSNGYNTIPLEIDARCTGVDSSSIQIAYSIDGDHVSGSNKVLATSNPSVGISALDRQGRTMLLGSDNATVVSLNNVSKKFEFAPRFYPVKIPNEFKSELGPFTTNITITATIL